MRRATLLLPLLFLGCATTGSGAGGSAGPSGPFVSQRLAITDRTATGFTVEVQLVLDNPGPGTMRIRTVDCNLTVADAALAKADLVLDQTAEAGERQGVVVPIKVELGSRAEELGVGEVIVRATGALHVSHRGDRDLPFSVMLDVPGQSLINR